jgi:hypothetical protein
MKRGKMVVFVLSIVVLSLMFIQVSSQAFQQRPRSSLKATRQVVAEAPLARLVQQARNTGQPFPLVDLFEREASHISASTATQSSNIAAAQNVLKAGTILRLDRGMARQILDTKLGNITLALQTEKIGTAELELVKVDIYTPDFSVVTSSSNGEPVKYEEGAHYRGVVKGHPGSLAAVSVFANEVMGLFSTPEEGNFVLGRLGGKNTNDDHILYSQDDLKEKQTFSCGTSDDGGVSSLSDLEEPQSHASRCVKIYVEADYNMFVNKGSVTGVTNYVTGFFNQSAALFANEGIPITISELFVWNKPSPYTQYTGSDSGTLLNAFRTFRSVFNGDFGHLISFRSNTGGIAVLNAYCRGSYDRRAYSGIFDFFNNVPAYSWTVNVFTHEMGHLMGSKHTHACAWNGNGTAIDGCGPTYDPQYTEGSCPPGPIPEDGGTIMSYCHLFDSVSINFSKGFGPQPGQVLRNEFNGAECIFTCF